MIKLVHHMVLLHVVFICRSIADAAVQPEDEHNHMPSPNAGMLYALPGCPVSCQVWCQSNGQYLMSAITTA